MPTEVFANKQPAQPVPYIKFRNIEINSRQLFKFLNYSVVPKDRVKIHMEYTLLRKEFNQEWWQERSWALVKNIQLFC